MMGHDLNNWYFNPAEKTLSVSNAKQLAEKWRFRISGMPTGSPVIVDGKVFATTTGGVYAIDLKTGMRLWSRTNIATTSSPAYEDGSLYVMNQTPPALYKLKASDGTTVWGPSMAYDPEWSDGESSPMLAGGKVIVGHSSTPREMSLDANAAPAARGGVEAWDAATGQKAWTYYTIPEVRSGTENGASVWSTVAIDVATSTVFATSGNNYTVEGPGGNAFHAFDLMTGERRWVNQVLKGDLFCLVCGMDLTKFDMDFGANPILAEIDGRPIVAAGNKGNSFFVLDRKTGELIWSRDKLAPTTNALTGGIFINSAFDGKHFYAVANDGDSETSTAYKLDAKTGANVWTHKFDATTWGATSLANGLFLVPANTKLFVLNAETGEVLTQFETGGTIAGGAASIAEGHVVVKSGLTYLANVTANDEIICYGLP